MSSLHWTMCETVLRSYNVTSFIRIRDGNGTETMVFDLFNNDFRTRFHIRINENVKRLTIISQPPWKMPEDKLSPALIYTTLLNYKLAVGSVDVDLNDGEIRFKTSAPFGNVVNIQPIFETFMKVHIHEAKKYLEGFAAIKDSNAEAEDAMRIAGMSGLGGDGASEGAGDDDNAAGLLLQLLLSGARRR